MFGRRGRRRREEAGRVGELFYFLRQTVRVTMLMVIVMAGRIGRRWLLVLLMVMGRLWCGAPNGRFRGSVRWDVPVGRDQMASYQSICLRGCNLWWFVILPSGESPPQQKQHQDNIQYISCDCSTHGNILYYRSRHMQRAMARRWSLCYAHAKFLLLIVRTYERVPPHVCMWMCAWLTGSDNIGGRAKRLHLLALAFEVTMISLVELIFYVSVRSWYCHHTPAFMMLHIFMPMSKRENTSQFSLHRWHSISNVVVYLSWDTRARRKHIYHKCTWPPPCASARAAARLHHLPTTPPSKHLSDTGNCNNNLRSGAAARAAHRRPTVSTRGGRRVGVRASQISIIIKSAARTRSRCTRVSVCLSGGAVWLMHRCSTSVQNQSENSLIINIFVVAVVVDAESESSGNVLIVCARALLLMPLAKLHTHTHMNGVRWCVLPMIYAVSAVLTHRCSAQVYVLANLWCKS